MKTENYKRLAEMKQWTFEQKLDHTHWCNSNICRRYCDKDMPAFFLNTGNEYPESGMTYRQTIKIIYGNEFEL